MMLMSLIRLHGFSRHLTESRITFQELQRQLSLSCIDHLKISKTLYAEPMKKKKKLDPAITKAREDRKKKKLEKEIRRMERNVAQFKPLEELEVSRELFNDIDKRMRTTVKLSEEEKSYRHRLEKKWAQYKYEQHKSDFAIIRKVIASKDKALKELEKESAELYAKAIDIDLKLIPFRCKGPLETPPIKDYEIVDGDYSDTTKKWD